MFGANVKTKIVFDDDHLCSKEALTLGEEIGKMEFRQKEFRHLNFDNVEFLVEFQNFSKFYRHFDNIVEFP